MIVAIDGPAGAGKSTVARRVAERLDLQYVNTGVLYRAVARKALEAGVSPSNGPAVAELARELRFEYRDQRLRCDGRLLGPEIQTAEVGKASSKVSSSPQVRDALLEIQRSLGRRQSSVLEGRDIGTVVFPDAEVKIFLTATARERARRRLAERDGDEESLESDEFEQVLEEIRRRDRRDRNRETAPLVCADDAVELDTTDLSVGEVVDRVVEIVDRDESRPR